MYRGHEKNWPRLVVAASLEAAETEGLRFESLRALFFAAFPINGRRGVRSSRGIAVKNKRMQASNDFLCPTNGFAQDDI